MMPGYQLNQPWLQSQTNNHQALVKNGRDENLKNLTVWCRDGCAKEVIQRDMAHVVTQGFRTGVSKLFPQRARL